MKFAKQQHSLEVINFDVDDKTQVCRHGPLLPNSIRGIICGPSGSGKTNLIVTLLFDVNGLRFNNVYVYSKSLYQEKYQTLESTLKKAGNIGYFPYKDSDEIIDPNEALENSIFIFDDVACERQEKIRDYFSMGRHRSVDSFYLCQTYTRIPKHLIRDNVNFIILFKMDELNLRNVYRDHVSPDITFTELLDICSACWKDEFGFIVIDKSSDVNNGRYRFKFDTYIYPRLV